MITYRSTKPLPVALVSRSPHHRSGSETLSTAFNHTQRRACMSGITDTLTYYFERSKMFTFSKGKRKKKYKTEILAATRQSSLILIGRPFRSRNKHSSALFFRSFRWKIPWRRREMPPALSVPSLSEWSTSLCSFLISLVRVLSEPSRDVNGTYEVESVCLVFHLIRELRSEGLKISTAIVKLGHT